MSMNKILKRLLIFFIGIPLVIGIVAVDFFHHLPLNAVVILCSFIAALELYAIFSRSTPLLPKPLVVFLSAALPFSAYIFLILKQNVNYINWFALAAAFILMTYEAFSKKSFQQSNTKVSASAFVVFYSGFLFTFLIKMTAFNNSAIFLSLFFLTVFLCDSFAWFFGVLFGKNNRGCIACSPNKSIAGFFGGYIGALTACAAAKIIWQDIFTGLILKNISLGMAVATAAIAGDLIESVFKRSADVKDSGTVILGRGGILDSMDSILAAAPVYYILVCVLYQPLPV